MNALVFVKTIVVATCAKESVQIAGKADSMWNVNLNAGKNWSVDTGYLKSLFLSCLSCAFFNTSVFYH